MKILCFGSLNLDYVYHVDHFVRAGETLSADDRKEFCGGKGLNQSIALAKAGAQVFHAGKIGPEGGALKAQLEKSGVDTTYLMADDAAPTGHAIIQVDPGGQNCILIFGGANQQITKEDIDRVLSGFARGDILLLQNEISNLGYLLEQAAARGLCVALNPSPITKALAAEPALTAVQWFILNEIEGFALTQREQPEAIAAELRRRYPGCRVVLTLGKKGVLYQDDAQQARHGIYRVPVVDTTAAGDTFTGYFLAATAEGLAVPRALELASIASSIAVGRAGASDSIPARTEVDAAELVLEA